MLKNIFYCQKLLLYLTMKATHISSTNKKCCFISLSFMITSDDIERIIWELQTLDEKITKISIEKRIKKFLYDQGNNYPELNNPLMDYIGIPEKEYEIRSIAMKFYPNFY